MCFKPNNFSKAVGLQAKSTIWRFDARMMKHI